MRQDGFDVIKRNVRWRLVFLLIEEGSKKPTLAWMFEAPQCLGFDLTDSLSRDSELRAARDILKRVSLATVETES